jgi:hypothetical protein
MTIHVDEIKVGKKKIEILSYLWVGLINLLVLPYTLLLWLVIKKHNPFDVADNNWKIWSFVNEHEIERRIVAETGFDGCIKFYELRTREKNINETFKEKFFGEFYLETDYGLFLRLFENPKSWPISYLYFIDKSDYSFKKIKKVRSSYIYWKYEFEDNKNFQIITNSEEGYTSILKINALDN